MLKNALSRINRSRSKTIYVVAILLLITVIFSGCSLGASRNDSADSAEATANLDLSQNQTLAAGFSNIMTATVASNAQATADTQISTSTPTTPISRIDSAKLTDLEGNVQVRQSNQPSFMTATWYYELLPNGQIKTLDFSKVRLDLPDDSIIRLGPNSLFTYIGKDTGTTTTGLLTRLRLETGKIWLILKGNTLEVDTPSGVASVRGSFMSVSVDPNTGTVYVTCLEGNCSLKNGVGTVNLVAGQTAKITNAYIPPTVGYMTSEEVNEWLRNNPEATAVIPELTMTARALPTTTATPKAGPTTIHSGTIPQAPK